MNFKFLALVAGFLPPVMRGSPLSDSSCSESFLEASQQGNREIVEEWIQKGADINCSNFNGKTALMFAALGGHAGVSRLLIEIGANVNHANINGKTALMETCLYDHLTIARLLIEYGADVNQLDYNGATALMSAACYGHFDMVQLLIENGAIVNHFDKLGLTALMSTARGEHLTISQLLIDNGADVNHVDNSGTTALMHAARFGHVKMAQLLIENGADVNLADATGNTALTLATSDWLTPDHIALCRLLILAGGGITEIDANYRQTCVDPIMSPLKAIQNSVRSHETFDSILISLHDTGISPIQALISFAFESLKNGVEVFGNSDIILFLQEHNWGPKKGEMVESIVKNLVNLQCTDLNVLYLVAPFISEADDDTLRRLDVTLGLMANAIRGLVRSTVGYNGRVLNAMMHRSAHLGFRPVLKAMYSIYWNAVQAQRAIRLRVPDDVSIVIDTFSQDLERDAMDKLAEATKRHHEASRSTESTSSDSFTSTSAEA